MADFSPFLTPTADWLDVTYSPNNNPADMLQDFLTAHNFVPLPETVPNQIAYRHVDAATLVACHGVLQVSTKHRAFRISASGGVLSTIRDIGAWNQYFTMLASCPYRITRLDAALDVFEDASGVLAALDLKYPREVSLSRQRSLPTKMLTARRMDGARSGTWYAGHRSRARVTARIYDKTLEVFDNTGVMLPDLLTRYEFTFREGVANLNDAYNPASIFYAHCTAVVSPPVDAPVWTPSDVPAWVSEPVEVLPSEALLRRVSSSLDLRSMEILAERVGPEGKALLMHAICKAIGIDSTGIRFKRAKG